MADTSGISVCFGTVEDSVMLEHAKLALQEMNAKFTDKIAIDTTHFVCTTPAAPGTAHGQPGVEYQRALQLSIPIVQPQWILACHQQKKCVFVLMQRYRYLYIYSSLAGWCRLPASTSAQRKLHL